MVARTDCAAAAAAALTGDGHDGRVYDITGPQLVDAEYGRYRADFSADPNNAAYFELFAGTGEAIRAGYLNQVGTGVQHLTSRSPVSLREVFGRG